MEKQEEIKPTEPASAPSRIESAGLPETSAPADISSKPRSRRTHKRYYNEKRYHSEVWDVFYCCIFMSTIAGQTAGPIGLNFFSS